MSSGERHSAVARRSLTPALPAIASSEAARVHERADAELDLLLSDLATWVDVDTPGGDFEALDGLARVLALEAQRYGLAPELVETPGGLALHATLRGPGQARVALLGHHDTVFPLGTAAARPFRRDETRCYGPGVADMKGGVAVALHTARLLAEGPQPFALLEVVSVPDEESRNGGPPSGGRLLHMDAVLCLECGRPNGEVVSRRKGARWFRIHASGRAAHAGEAPDEGRNAALALAREALRIGELHGAREDLTLQITGLDAGEGLNTVPSSGALTVDLRAWSEQDLAWALEQALAYGDHEGIELSYEDLGGPPPLERTVAVGRLAEAAIALGGELGHVFGETAAGGVSDGSWAASEGIPTLDGLGPVGGEDHTPWEYIETASLALRCGVVAGLVAAVDAGLLR
jgi:glutamate carboxypeptidase